MENVRLYEQFEVKNAQKVNFPQIAIITQGTFFTFLTDSIECFKDYRAKKSKNCSIRLNLRNILTFFGGGG